MEMSGNVQSQRFASKSLVAHHAPVETPTELCGAVRPVECNNLSDLKGRALFEIIILASLSSTLTRQVEARTNQMGVLRRGSVLYRIHRNADFHMVATGEMAWRKQPHAYRPFRRHYLSCNVGFGLVLHRQQRTR